MAQYNEYKDSGQQWLGKVPSHWKIMKLRGVFDENTTQNIDHTITKQLQFKFGTIIPKVLNYDAEDADWSIIEKYNIVQPNDIVINGLNLNYDFNSHRVGLVTEEGIITSAYIVMRPKGHFNPSYLNYALKGWDSRKLLHGMGTGVRITLSWKELKNYSMPIPPADEQAGIVAYLDKVTADIDKAIAAKERIISALEERRKIIITEAVTRGINPDAPLRDSGIDWLGQIPEHWEVRKLKYLANLKSGKNLTSEDINPEYFEGAVPVYGGNGVRGYYKTHNTSGNYALIGRQGALCGNINYAQGNFWATDHAVVCYLNRDLPLLWFGEMLKVANLNQYATKSAQPGLSVERIKKIYMPYPPLEEIRAIQEYLQIILSKFEVPISQQRKAIDLLRERKAIIINEVVTGKVKVV